MEICGKGRELGRLKVKSLKLKVKTPENPGNRLERLKGDRNDQYSIGVNDQWRTCFVWRDGHAYEVEMVNYH